METTRKQYLLNIYQRGRGSPPPAAWDPSLIDGNPWAPGQLPGIHNLAVDHGDDTYQRATRRASLL